MPLFIIPLSTLEVNDFQPMGITPAYAGKSLSGLPPAGTAEDHPRLCGEKEYLTIGLVEDMGSPPPMRGKALGTSYIRDAVCRITPAYAGKSVASRWLIAVRRDHPRLCGEKAVVAVGIDTDLGSPPPMRGKGVVIVCVITISRITPAYAGKSHP